MSVGLQVTKGDADAHAGSIAQALDKAMTDVLDFNDWLTSHTDTDLEALGYTPEDIALLRSAYVDAKLLADIFYGREPLAAPKDFTAFLKRIWGFGSL